MDCYLRNTQKTYGSSMIIASKILYPNALKQIGTMGSSLRKGIHQGMRIHLFPKRRSRLYPGYFHGKKGILNVSHRYRYTCCRALLLKSPRDYTERVLPLTRIFLEHSWPYIRISKSHRLYWENFSLALIYEHKFLISLFKTLRGLSSILFPKNKQTSHVSFPNCIRFEDRIFQRHTTLSQETPMEEGIRCNQEIKPAVEEGQIYFLQNRPLALLAQITHHHKVKDWLSSKKAMLEIIPPNLMKTVISPSLLEDHGFPFLAKSIPPLGGAVFRILRFSQSSGQSQDLFIPVTRQGFQHRNISSFYHLYTETSL